MTCERIGAEVGLFYAGRETNSKVHTDQNVQILRALSHGDFPCESCSCGASPLAYPLVMSCKSRPMSLRAELHRVAKERTRETSEKIFMGCN